MSFKNRFASAVAALVFVAGLGACQKVPDIQDLATNKNAAEAGETISITNLKANYVRVIIPAKQVGTASDLNCIQYDNPRSEAGDTLSCNWEAANKPVNVAVQPTPAHSITPAPAPTAG